MNFLLAATPAAQPNLWVTFLTMLPWLGFLFIMYWVLIAGPMRKKQKQFQEMMGALKAGDRIVTNSGIFGTVISIGEKIVKVRIANNVVVEMERTAVAGLAPEEKEEKKS